MNKLKLSDKELKSILNKAFNNDQYVTIITTAKKLLETNQSDTVLLLKLGSALVALARYKEAIEVLEKAIALLPDERIVLAYIYMGEVYKNQYNFEQACEWYKKIIDLKPNDTDGYIYLGSALARQGKLAEAEEIHRKGIKCNEGCIDEAYYNLGLVLRAQDKLEESKFCFEKSLEIDPDYQEVKDSLDDVLNAISVKEA